jgi:ADP-heptose:LPS heptosyltransferase
MNAVARFALQRPLRRILLIRPRALGDVLLATPAVRALRAGYPEAEIHMLVDDVLAPLLDENPYLDRLWCFPRQRRGLGRWARLYRDINRARFDLVIDLHGTPRTAFLARWSGAPNRVGYALRGRGRWYNFRVERDSDRRGVWRQQYAARTNLDIVARCGVVGPVLEDTSLVFVTNRAAEIRIREYFDSLPSGAPYVGVAPAGTWQAKTYPVASFARVADRLAQAGCTIILLWGPGERAIVDAAREAMQAPAVVAPATGLHELAALLGRLDLLLSNDSGVKHLAVARGTPTLTLFGPTSPVNWVSGLREHAWLRSALPCVGCNFTRCLHHTCMSSLDHTTVAAQALRHLGKARQERLSMP